jgi:hypothetical protein
MASIVTDVLALAWVVWLMALLFGVISPPGFGPDTERGKAVVGFHLLIAAVPLIIITVLSAPLIEKATQ